MERGLERESRSQNGVTSNSSPPLIGNLTHPEEHHMEEIRGIVEDALPLVPENQVAIDEVIETQQILQSYIAVEQETNRELRDFIGSIRRFDHAIQNFENSHGRAPTLEEVTEMSNDGEMEEVEDSLPTEEVGDDQNIEELSRAHRVLQRRNEALLDELQVLQEIGRIFDYVTYSPCPPSPALLSSPTLRSIIISADQINNNNSITSTCAVCYIDFELGEEVSELHCRHIYHSPCISKWQGYGDTCPICRLRMAT